LSDGLYLLGVRDIAGDANGSRSLCDQSSGDAFHLITAARVHNDGSAQSGKLFRRSLADTAPPAGYECYLSLELPMYHVLSLPKAHRKVYFRAHFCTYMVDI
jgi:hypothetical protein